MSTDDNNHPSSTSSEDSSVQRLIDLRNDEYVRSLERTIDEMTIHGEALRARSLEIEERWRQYVESEVYQLDESQPGYEVVELGDGYRRVTHKRLSVILDSNGWYNASKICRENDLEFVSFINHPDTVLSIYCNGYSEEPYAYHATGDNETKGYYVPPLLVSRLVDHAPTSYRRRFQDIWHEIRFGRLL